MKIRQLLLKIGAILSSSTLLVLFVWHRASGPVRAEPEPPRQSATPRDFPVLIHGSKSGVIFKPAAAPTPRGWFTGNMAPKPRLMPGSKNEAIIRPSDLSPSPVP